VFKTFEWLAAGHFSLCIFSLNGSPGASSRDSGCARNAPKLNVLNGLGLTRERSLGDGFSIARHDNEAKAARLR
jgi:hypothetical protein